MSIPAAFDYHPARSVDEAIALLQQYGDEAKVLAGGHSLIPTMKLRLAQPGHIIDIGKIDGLAYIREDGDAIAIGALTTYTMLERSELVSRTFPALADGVSVIGDPQVRNRGTIGGSVAHSDPAADMPGIVRALRAHILVQGPGGTRTINIDDFFQGMFATALEADEIITELRFERPRGRTGSAYTKLANKASHYAVAGCAAVVTLGGDGTCETASVVLTGVSMMASRADSVEAALVGQQLNEAAVAAATAQATDGLELVEDIHGSKAYRARMASVMAQRAILKAAARV